MDRKEKMNWQNRESPYREGANPVLQICPPTCSRDKEIQRSLQQLPIVVSLLC